MRNVGFAIFAVIAVAVIVLLIFIEILEFTIGLILLGVAALILWGIWAWLKKKFND